MKIVMASLAIKSLHADMPVDKCQSSKKSPCNIKNKPLSTNQQSERFLNKNK